MPAKITLVELNKPLDHDLNKQLQWFGASLGLFNLRDKDKSCFRIFIELLRAEKAKKALTSDEISDCLNLSRGTVIHHINKLMSEGIVVHKKNKYSLREKDLSALIEQLKKDIKTRIDDLKEVAVEIDKKLEL